MKGNNLSIKRYRLSVCLAVLGLFISSCAAVADLLPTTTPIPSATPTCLPPPQRDGLIEEIDSRPTLLVFLVESQLTELTTIEQAYDFIGSRVPQLLVPGDHVVVLRTGFSTYEDSKVVDQNPIEVTRQAIPSSPTAPAILEPPTQITPTSQTSLGQGRDRDNATATANVLHANATAEWHNFNCEFSNWGEIFSEEAQDWEATRESVVRNMTNELQGTLEASKPDFQTTPRVFPRANSLIEGLIQTNRILDGIGCTKEDTSDSRYKRCVLIVWDDMSDWRQSGITNYDFGINLNNIDSLIVMTACERYYEPECAELWTFWKDQFDNEFKAKSAIYTDILSAEEELNNLLREQ